jgi:hypothetical protein
VLSHILQVNGLCKNCLKEKNTWNLFLNRDWFRLQIPPPPLWPLCVPP